MWAPRVAVISATQHRQVTWGSLTEGAWTTVGQATSSRVPLCQEGHLICCLLDRKQMQRKMAFRWILEGFLDVLCVCVFVFWCFVFGFALLVFGGFMGHAVQLAGSQFLNQGSNFRPLQWTHAVLTTRPPGRPQGIYFPEQQLPVASLQHTQLPWCVCLLAQRVERLS